AEETGVLDRCHIPFVADRLHPQWWHRQVRGRTDGHEHVGATASPRPTAAPGEPATPEPALGAPSPSWTALGHLRRLGWTANELLERLLAVRCPKEAE